jgi:Cu2+-containing amine oxidase
MMRRIHVAAAAVGLTLMAAPADAQQYCSTPYFVQQSFPTAGPAQTTWRLCWQTQPGWGLIITAAFFQKSPTAPFIRVFWDARISDIFVPYHPGSPRFYDLSVYGFGSTTVSAADCPVSVGGMPLANVVCKEVRDRGLMWKDDAQVRRGQELVLWTAIDAANYNYIVEWSFRDDGVVLGRLGATAVNLPSMATTAHMHNAVWRLDIDLNGFWGDAVRQGIHSENLPGNSATDTDPLIATETGLQWDDLAFHSLDIHDATLTNSRGHATSYHLIPLRSGTARHAEAFTKNDFWVTRYHAWEMRPSALPTYISPAESVSNTDIVVWYWGSVHHLPRDEDGETTGGYWRGEAHLMWTGFMLKPNNLFDTTPFYP